jgi:hypothetical protein
MAYGVPAGSRNCRGNDSIRRIRGDDGPRAAGVEHDDVERRSEIGCRDQTRDLARTMR